MSDSWADVRQAVVRNVEPKVVRKDLVADLLADADVLLAVVKPLVQFDLQGAISWAKVIVEEWKAGEQDWASMKVAEKLLKIAPDLEDALAALPEHLRGDVDE